jgi:hypothetical protein
MCDYTGYEFGAPYHDGVCIEGYLWDADSGDSDGLTCGGDLPCPKCNTEHWLEHWKSQWVEDGYNDPFYTMKNKGQVLAKLTKSSLYKNQCAMVKGAKAVIKRKILRGFYERNKS